MTGTSLEIRVDSNNPLFKDYSALVADAMSGAYSLAELGILYGPTRGILSRQRVKQILDSRGIGSINQYRREYKEQSIRRKIEEEKRDREQYTARAVVLAQQYFDHLRVQEGENYALAWRAQTIYGVGKKYSLETLATLFEGRRSGMGFYRAIKYAGIATEHREIIKRIHPIAHIIEKALRDIDYPKQVRKLKNN